MADQWPESPVAVPEPEPAPSTGRIVALWFSRVVRSALLCGILALTIYALPELRSMLQGPGTAVCTNQEDTCTADWFLGAIALLLPLLTIPMLLLWRAAPGVARKLFAATLLWVVLMILAFFNVMAHLHNF